MSKKSKTVELYKRFNQKDGSIKNPKIVICYVCCLLKQEIFEIIYES